MNLDTDAIKSARELISGIAINVSAIQIGRIRFAFDGASRGIANRNDEAKGKEREHVDVRDPDIPCRVDTARGRHVTPNIGRKPKLITTASILLEMPFYPGFTNEGEDQEEATRNRDLYDSSGRN
ncbi:hypothetical protein ALC56_04320 [Trachymyrmex septentrionalis]|uniref:Uncharacterized protein n=1 Tax=Trachymyrmex septentrionalis TaxID=34720 RepID=A0A195FMJ4_9HYME|nr:hypothetical protein ALC56_04320 [Trachymyrmex septentrionalis]